MAASPFPGHGQGVLVSQQSTVSKAAGHRAEGVRPPARRSRGYEE